MRLLASAVTVAAAVVTVGAASVVTAPPAAAAGPCTTQVAHVHYETGATSSASSPTQVIKISAVLISDLGSGCNTLTAKLVLEGNPAGSSATPATTLSTATSTRDPCTHAKLSSPPTVQGGKITLDLCRTPSATARYVSVHDLTKLTLTVGGAVVSVTPTTGASSGSPGSGSGTKNIPVSTAASSSGLAFTGADIAAMTVGGLLVILLGLFLVLLSRRRRSEASGGETL